MTYKLAYEYRGRQNGRVVSGTGCAKMTVDADRITERVIDNGVAWVERKLENQGMIVEEVFPLGWMKFEEEPA